MEKCKSQKKTHSRSFNPLQFPFLHFNSLFYFKLSAKNVLFFQLALDAHLTSNGKGHEFTFAFVLEFITSDE